MHPALSRSVAAAVLAAVVLVAHVAPALAGGGGQPRVRVDPRFPPLSRSNPAWSGRQGAVPHAYGYGAPRRAVPAAPRRPVINCDQYGRCWQAVPGYGGRGYGYRAPLGTRPPGWADDLPYRAQGADRFFRPRSGVSCDRATSVCYKGGRIDKSETQDFFGGRAADRADDLRDDRGTAQLFVPERGVTCDRGRRVCFDDGNADHSLTRRYFGQRAADAIR